MMILVTGLVGLAMVVTFLGFLAWWIKELPFTIIVIGVLLLAVYDFLQSLRSSDGGTGGPARGAV